MINAETGNLKLAQKLLGHSNINTTADVYTHTSSEEERQAALALEKGQSMAICSKLFQKLRTGTATGRLTRVAALIGLASQIQEERPLLS